MLTTAVSTSAVSTAATSTAAGAISMTTNVGIPEYGVLAVIGLIAFLSAKEILSACSKWNRSISSLLDISILPLLVSFAAIVVYKVVEII
jgi:hypothetical protein